MVHALRMAAGDLEKVFSSRWGEREAKFEQQARNLRSVGLAVAGLHEKWTEHLK